MGARPANYEYGFYWYLYQDGTIQFEAKLTGIVSTHALFPSEVANGGKPEWGALVSPGVNAHQHQHFFTVRLDMAVDCPEGGKALRVRAGGGARAGGCREWARAWEEPPACAAAADPPSPHSPPPVAVAVSGLRD